MSGSSPIFTYWEGDASALDPFRADWRAAGHQATVFDRDEARALVLDGYGPESLALFDRIRIPACRSDVARLALLHAHGGLYVDAHTGSGDQAKLAILFAHLARKELVVIDHVAEHKTEVDTHLQNAAMLARAGSAVLRGIIEATFVNLERHSRLESQTPDYVQYNIFAMTGGWHIQAILFNLAQRPFQLKPEFVDRVRFERINMKEDGLPFRWYQHYRYRKPGQHWSERQQVERLFEP